MAYAAEAGERVSGGEPFVTVDGARMARKTMFYSSAKAERELGYTSRPLQDALRDALDWFSARGYLR